MDQPSCLSFPPFRLDSVDGRLYRETTVIRLRPKTLALLHYLATHAGELLSKQALLDSVWPDAVVAEGGLTELVRELRKTLGDDAKMPRFIETVHGRGYRFLPAVSNIPRGRLDSRLGSLASEDENLPGARVLPAEPRPQAPAVPMVGRQIELARLSSWFEQVRHGHRQVIFVTGEPGIGKTTVVEAFLQQVAADRRVRLSRGQCIEQYGASEAYLPVLEALARLARQPDGFALVSVLERYAPTWLAQMPALLTPQEFDALQRRVAGSTQERMLREIAEALEVLAAERPLVLLFEDLHWSDYSTLDLLVLLAQRRELACLMIVATYRPAEVFSREHPLKNVKQELQARGRCVELPLPCLSEAAVAEYLEKRFPGPSRGEPSFRELAPVVYRRTDGHPLFMVNVADYVAAQDPGGVNGLLEQSIPETVRQMIEKQIDRLDAVERRLLEVASVAGVEFSAASVAAGLATDDLDGVEQSCEELARRAQFLQLRGKSSWPDGTIAARYGFVHALYQNVFYYRVTPGRRARLHLRIGRREEGGYGENAIEIATGLAMHFEEGQEYPRALHYLMLAGEKAVRRFANGEAIDLFQKGLALLGSIPESSARTRDELLLHIALGVPLIHSRGYAAAEVGRAYGRARELYSQAGETSQLFSVLWGLWLYYVVRADHAVAYDIGQQLRSLAENEHVTFPLGYYAPGVSLFWLGDILRTREYLQRGLALYEPAEHGAHIFLYSQDPKTVSLSYQSWVLWLLGYPDQALRCSREAIEWAREVSHPFSLAFAWDFAAEVPRLRREGEETRRRAEAAIAIGTEQGFPFWIAWGALLRGWALAEQGKHTEGISVMREGLAAYTATGAEMGKTWFLSLLADACGKAGRPKVGLEALSEAFEFLNKTNERAYEAELYRLKGELTLQPKVQGRRSKAIAPPLVTPDVQGEAESCFLKSVDIARKQHAKSWELRATMSLVRLRRQQATQPESRALQRETRTKLEEARIMLADVYNWFTEGFDTRDLQHAKALLEE